MTRYKQIQAIQHFFCMFADSRRWSAAIMPGDYLSFHALPVYKQANRILMREPSAFLLVDRCVKPAAMQTSLRNMVSSRIAGWRLGPATTCKLQRRHRGSTVPAKAQRAFSIGDPSLRDYGGPKLSASSNKAGILVIGDEILAGQVHHKQCFGVDCRNSFAIREHTRGCVTHGVLTR